MKENESEKIFSSTGSLGVTRRQDDRLYVNGTHYVNDPLEVAVNFGRMTTIAAEFPDKIGRAVYRGAVSNEVVESIQDTKLARYLEVALPLSEFIPEDNSWLIYLAKNHIGRGPIVPISTMIEETNRQREVSITPVERIDQILERGYQFRDNFSEAQIGQLYALWHDTFGWEKEQLESLRHRLDKTAQRNPAERDVWFSAVEDNDEIISAAMAERLTIPANNRDLDLVESTEWRTKDGYEGQGLMTATLAMLNSQVLADLRFSPNGTPLIFAECNFQSRSDRAGHGAGLTVPDRVHAQQLIVQNVHIGDSADVQQHLRDFSPMYLPMNQVVGHYSQENVDKIMQYRNAV